MPSSKHPDLNSIISDFYRDIDPNILNGNESLERIQQNCVEQANPFACYFTLLLGETPEITWRHNINRHFGIIDLRYEDVFTLIHPAWLFAYINYARAMYKVARNHPELSLAAGVSAGSLIPMRHHSGEYYWYHQISVKVADDGPNMAAHLNYYHQSTSYEGQLPNLPSLTTSGEPNHSLIAELSGYALEFLPDFLGEFLSKSQVRFVLQYRKLISDKADAKRDQKKLLAQIDGVDTVENLNKIKQRIRQKLTSHFQHPSLDSVYGLAIWLNRYFPLEATE